jgi:hypothetical protein
MSHDRGPRVLLSLVLLSTACGDGYQTPTTPTSPAPAPSPVISVPTVPSRPATNWKADATVTNAVYGDGGPCGWGTRAGEARQGVEWTVTIDGGSIRMDEDKPNWPTDDVPYSGVLTGNELSVRYDSGPGYLTSPCKWRGATLSGRFNEDRSVFEATELVFWGTIEGGTTVTRRWSGYALR